MRFVFFCILCSSAVIASSSSSFGGELTIPGANLHRSEKLLLRQLQCPDITIDESRIEETLFNLGQRITESWAQAENLKMAFIKDAMGARPESLEEALDGWREHWLPEIPATSVTTFQSLGEEATEKLIRNFTVYTIALQQVHRDIMHHEPAFKHRVKRLENRCKLILCQARAITGIHLDSFLISEVVSRQAQNMSFSRSSRNHHIYLILRDLSRYLAFSVKFVNYTLSNLTGND